MNSEFNFIKNAILSKYEYTILNIHDKIHDTNDVMYFIMYATKMNIKLIGGSKSS